MNVNMDNIINISSNNIAGKCDYKCAYTYAYLDTDVVVHKSTNMISLINKGIEPVVTYNNNNYMVSSTMIVSPSLHKFNDKKTDGEIIIEHMPIQGGKKMYVCIPITQSTAASTNASASIDMIIGAIKAGKTPEQNSTSKNIYSIDLNSFIPKGKFYSYSGYDLNNDVSDFVVFGIENMIPMNQSIFNSLTEIIQPISAQMKGGDLFLNEKGPNDVISSSINLINTSAVADFIGTSGVLGTSDDNPVVVDDSSSSPFIDNEMISIITQIFLNCLFFFALFYIINFIFNYLLSGVKPKIYSIT